MAFEFDASTAKPDDGSFDPTTAKIEKPSGALRKLADYPLAVAGGAVGAVKAIADAAGAGNAVSETLDNANKGINSYLSPEAKVEDQKISALMGDAQAKGMNWEGVKAGAKAFGIAPVRTALSGVGSIAPIVAGTALTGGVLPAAVVGGGIGVAMGAGTAKGAIFDDIKKRSLESGMNEADATAAATKAQEYGGVNTDQIALGGALGAADALTGVSKAASGMLGNAIRKPITKAASTAPQQGIFRRAGMGMLGEMPLEAAQGGQEQVAANVAAQRAGFDAGTWDNVASKATLEALASAGPGAAFGAMNTNKAPSPIPTPEPTSTIPTPARLGYNPTAGTHTVFPDGSVILNSDKPAGEQAVFDKRFAPQQVKASEAMGIDPAAGPLSKAAATAVDIGAYAQSIPAAEATPIAAATPEFDASTAREADVQAYDAHFAPEEPSNLIAKQATNTPVTAKNEAENAPTTQAKAVEAGTPTGATGAQQAATDTTARAGSVETAGINSQQKENDVTQTVKAVQAAQKGQTPTPPKSINLVPYEDKPAVKSNLAGKSGSWVIKEKSTGNVVMETFDRKMVDALNTEKYEAVPIREHLVSLNEKPAAVSQDAEKAGLATQNIAAEASNTPASGAIEVAKPVPAGLAKMQAAKQQSQFEEDEAFSALSEFTYTSAELDALGDVPFDLVATGPKLSTEAAMREMGFTEQEIQDAVNKERITQSTENEKSSISAGETVTEQPQAGTSTTESSAESVTEPVVPAGLAKMQAGKTAKAIERITKGTAYFRTTARAKEFIESNGLKDTHEFVKHSSGANRWDIVAKAAKSERETRIETTLKTGGHVVGDELRMANGMVQLKLTPAELAAIPADKVLVKPEPEKARTEPKTKETQAAALPAIRAEQMRQQKIKVARASRLASMTYNKSPFLAFLGKHGIAWAEKREFSPDKNPMLSGYGPMFRKNGLPIDLLVSRAVEDGFLPPGTEDDTKLRELISRQLRGESIAALYTEDGATEAMQAEIDRRAGFDEEQLERDAEAQLQQQFDEEALELIANSAFIDENYPDPVDALLELGFTYKDIEDTYNDYNAQNSGQSEDAQTGRGAGSAAASEAKSPSPTTPSPAQEEGLTTPTRAGLLAQQDRAAQAEKDQAAADKAAEKAAKAAADKKEIDARQEASADNFQLGQSAEDSLSGQASMFDAPAEPAKKPEKVISQDELRAKADLQAALADLGDIFNKPFKANMMPEQEQKLLPVLTRVLDAAFRLGYVKFKDAAKFALDQIKAALGQDMANALTLDHLQGAYISMASGKTGVSTKREVIDVEDKSEIEGHTAQTVADIAEKASTLADSFYEAIKSGNMPKDNPALRKMVETFDGKPADNARLKEAQEELEAAIARTTRDVIAKGKGQRETFDELLRMYNSQPLLNIRTSTSIANMAYSTPAPLAYLTSELAGITQNDSVLEPTGGTGMLIAGANPSKTLANELNDHRAELLRAQGFTVTQDDAAYGFKGTFDKVNTNPPFGSIKDDKGNVIKVPVDGYRLGQIDHLIAARALAAMKDDGKATLILGANKVAGGISNDDLIFFNWLYGHYNVTGHFEVNGDLYARQGAGWPVRVISINGRQKSNKTSPIAGTVKRADNWNQVYEYFTDSLATSWTESNPSATTSAGSTGTGETNTKPVRTTTSKPPADANQRQPTGSAGGNGNVAGATAGAVSDLAKPAKEPVGASAGTKRLDATTSKPDRLDAGGVNPDNRADKPAGAAGTSTLSSGENQFQASYIPRSSRKDEGVLIPVNMKEPTQDALSKLEDAVGNIDDYAAKELGYASTKELHDALMGLQVDSVASSIYQIKQGKGVVIADQTGIGKGRQAAAIIRWAAKQGHIPVFVTVKPSLFTDMYGDLADIGTNDINPFIMNGSEWISGAGGEKLFSNKPLTHKNKLSTIAATSELPTGSNALFMTYSQINVDNTQRKALTALADKAVFILDESHNAGGASATGEFITSVLGAAKGVTYLSATYAKRPDNMPLYFKTDIGQASADNEGLMAAMAAGGLPLQTVVSNNLVKAGQMFRRERSYDGVNIESKTDSSNQKAHEATSDKATAALRSIVAADAMFHEVYVKEKAKELAALGSVAIDNAGNQAQAGVQHTEFSSVVHNFVRQMLLGLKAQSAADDAIAALKRGEKPIIAVENTMGSFLNEYAATNGITQGGSLGSFDYRTVLTRALARTRVLTEQKPNGDKVKKEVPLSALDGLTREAYRQAQEVIDGLDLDIPVSPIDWMRSQIQKAGFSVSEITGRNLTVDYSTPIKPVLSALSAQEQNDKVQTTRLFNSGKLDALILNVAGSTGISLHASEKFTDQRQRHMIVAQPAQDINIFMQMLGRIHRTGQVKLPKYTILSVDLPTEKRPTALLSKKMKSLNANTSSNTESATSVKTADMLNKYGDQIVSHYLQDNYALAKALGVEDMLGEDGVEDIARKATGRLALQPISVQNAFYSEVEGQYNALLEYLNKTNQNDLEPRTFDFDAKETSQEVLFEGADKSTPFGEDAIYGEYSIKAQGVPMKAEEIKAAMTENLDGKTSETHVLDMVKTLTGQFESFYKLLPDTQQDSARRILHEGTQFLQSHRIGRTFRVDINGDTFNAVVTNIRSTHKTTGNPLSLSKVQVSIAVNGALRHISVPATQFQKIEVSTIGAGYTVEQLFKEQPADQRETAKIVTGNLLAAYGEIDGARGTIISFTKADGTTEQGILLPKTFDFKKNTRGDFRLSTGAIALKFLQESDNKDIGRFGIMSRDSIVRVLPSGQGIAVLVPKSKLKGAKFFLDKGLIEVLGDFVTSGNYMKATTYNAADAVNALELLMKKQALYALPSMAEEAKAIAEKPAFSRGQSATGLPTTQVKSITDTIKARWSAAPEIVIAANMDDKAIPQAVRDHNNGQLSQGAQGQPEGFIYRGKVYLIADQLATPKDVMRVLFHETLGHVGLRGAFGESLTPILKQIATMRRAEVAAKAKEYGLDMAKESDRLQAAEEVLAVLAETKPEMGFVKRAVAAIRNWLRSHGVNLKLSDNDIIANYILPARAWVQSGKAATAGNLATAFSRSIGETLKAVTVTDIKAKAGNKLADYRNLGLQFLGGRQLADLYGNDIPQIDSYTKMVQQMSADANEVGAQADAIVTSWAGLKDERQLAELMHDATLMQIDPAKDYVDGDNRMQWGKLNTQFKALTPEAKKIFTEARDSYEEHYSRVREAIQEKIERSAMGKESKARMLERMDGEFFDKIKGVYFPLARFGKYVVVTRDGAGNVVNVSRAETLNEAEALRKDMQTAYPRNSGYAVGKVLKDKEFNASRDAVGRGFLKELFGVLDEKGVGDQLQDAVNQLYLASMPDLSWAKHGIHRKGTPGFSQDARRAYAQNMFHGARYLAKLRFADQLQDKLTAMEDFVESKNGDETFDQPRARDVVNEYVARHDTLMNPKSSPLSTALTSFGFVFHMGLSPASAMVNLSGTALVAYPIMGAKWGFDKAAGALLMASKQAATNKNDISKALSKDEKLAYDAAVKAGTIDVTAAHDLAGIAQGEDAGVMWKIRPVMKWASFMFHHAERFNRQVTFVASYRLARGTGANHETAFEQATKATYDTHFDYSASNRPRIMQGNAARVLLLFKQYGQNMVYTLTRQAQLAMNAETPQGRKEARKALGGLLVMHASAAGVLGLPLVGPLLAAASMLGGSDDEPWDAETALRNMLADTFGQKPAEVMAKGFSRLTPWDISGRVGLNHLILPDVQEGLEGQRLGESAMAAALGPVAGIGINILKGMQEISEGHVARGYETMMPVALRSPMKALRYEMEGAKDKTGVMIQDEVSAAGVAGQALGFSPSDVRNATEGRSAIFKADGMLMQRRKELMSQYARAATEKDAEAMAEVREAIKKFNDVNPNRRISNMNMIQSVKNKEKRVEEAQSGVFLPRKRRDAIEEGRFAEAE